MEIRKLIIAFLFVGLAFSVWPNSSLVAAGKIKAVKFGKLIDGTGKVLINAIVVIDGNHMTSVGTDKSAIPAGAEVIDMSRFTAIPGLIDVHTHMTYYWDQEPGSKPWAQAGSRMPAVTVFLAQENARKTLESGVTSVRDLGSSNYSDIAMRDLINRGAMAGPRMFVAGYGLSLSRAAAAAGTTPMGGRAHGVDEVKAAVKRQVDAGADVIKMYASTGSANDVSGRETFSFEEIKAAVDAAHAAGKRIAIHSYGPDGARDAIRAGADSVEHATDMDDATIADMARRKTFYVPTIDHNRYYVEFKDQFGYGDTDVNGLNDYIQRNLETARRAYKAGVRFAMGSDAVFTMFGQNTRELGWMIKVGMTPAEALATATTNAAALLGMEDKLGCIAPGCYADIVAVNGDPLSDINVVINNVRWVMKGGTVMVDRTRAGK
ncbi:MAG TPA: amidohydrolase family protein [Blastocatellia bacterium]|nr:amidohydrolase family protein [Blastocatellia bacterium]